MNPAEFILCFLMELERLVPGQGTRHMISTTDEGKLEIRIGSGDWYRVSDGVTDDPDPYGRLRRSSGPGALGRPPQAAKGAQVTVSRKGFQGRDQLGHRSHASGKRAPGFAARIKENLDKQCARLEKEICGHRQERRVDN